MSTTGKRVLVAVAMVVAGVCFVAGLLIGWFLLDEAVAWSRHGPALGKLNHSGPTGHEDRPAVSARLIQEIQASNIERHLR